MIGIINAATDILDKIQTAAPTIRKYIRQEGYKC